MERAGLVGCYARSRERAAAVESLLELEALANAAGARVLESVMQERLRRDPATFVGSGKAEELKDAVGKHRLDLLIFDDELSPGQQRNLEHLVGCKILDRTQLILDIFARRARTREGKLQVELAQLNYLLPRLTGKGTMLSRLGAGIGTRGPGETKLEMDRRRIRGRISLLRRDIEKIRQQREIQRSKRQGVPLPVVALVGYTNAGKSTLFNALTSAETVASDQLFATLDPLMRRLCLPNKLEIILSDTVGFVRKLPHEIVAAFRATLEEVQEADLLLHVIDRSNLHWREQAAAVEEVLEELRVQNTPRMEVYNKIDALWVDTPTETGEMQSENAIEISAKKRDGLEDLIRRIMTALESHFVQMELIIPYPKAGLLSQLHERGNVTSELFEDRGIRVGVELPQSLARSLQRYRSQPSKPSSQEGSAHVKEGP